MKDSDRCRNSTSSCVTYLIVLLQVLVVGCSSPRFNKPNISYTLEDVVLGSSKYTVQINKATFEHSSSIGALEFAINRQHNVVRVTDFLGLGTFVTTGIDHYYFVDADGTVVKLGHLKSSWYIDERLVECTVGNFVPLEIKPEP